MIKKVLITAPEGVNYEQSRQLSLQVKSYLSEQNVVAHLAGDIDMPDIQPDIVVAIGGDGTIMRAMKKYSQYGVPTFGINGGRLGFLAGAERDNWREALLRLLVDDYCVEERLALQFEFGGRIHGPFVNEVKIADESRVMFYQADIGKRTFWHAVESLGLFLATATGSTAEHFSNRGGPMFPTSMDVSLMPKNPQQVGFDPFKFPQLSQGESVTLTFLGGAHGETEVDVVADGIKISNNGALLQAGESLIISKAPKPMLLATFGLEQFFRALEQKKGYPLSRNNFPGR